MAKVISIKKGAIAAEHEELRAALQSRTLHKHATDYSVATEVYLVLERFQVDEQFLLEFLQWRDDLSTQKSREFMAKDWNFVFKAIRKLERRGAGRNLMALVSSWGGISNENLLMMLIRYNDEGLIHCPECIDDELS